MLSGDLVKVTDYWSWRESVCDCVCGSRPESGERRLVTRSDWAGEAQTPDKASNMRGRGHPNTGLTNKCGHHTGDHSTPQHTLVTTPHDGAWKTGSRVLRGNESRPWWLCPISGTLDRPWMTLWWFWVSGALSLSVTLRAASLWRPSWRLTVTATIMMTRSRQTLTNFKSFISEEGEKMLFINEC